jgi:UDP-N-acetylmuramoyl-tripeptide--D-alanyl-D-alanine ligase
MSSDLTVKQIVNICDGTLFSGDENTICKTYNKDTRILNAGDTYIGIKGENFDGNSLYQDAFFKGANCCILERDSFEEDKDYNYDKPIILVDNARNALRLIASYIRDNSDSLFIGVTGSVGKTSTRDMIYSVVSQEYKSLKTEGNYNNDIGLPLTLMRLKDEECAVIEMGMNNLGEIDYLTKITKPHIAVITNVGTAHIGNLGSRENILKAKLEIKNGLVEDGTLVINNDNDLLHEYYLNNKDNIMTVGIENESDVTATDINIDEDKATFNINYKDEVFKVTCPVPSEAFVYNSLVAFAVGVLSKVPVDKIIEGISKFELTNNRLNIIEKDNITIINDCYNASLDSMKSSLQVLKNQKGKRKIAVLGDMLELGDYSKELHESVGQSVIDNNIDVLVTVGTNAKYIASIAKDKLIDNVYSFDNNIDAINKLKEIIKDEDTILIKASNGMKFIEIVNELK